MRLLPISHSRSFPPISLLSSSFFLLLSLLSILPSTSAATPDLRTLTLYYTTPTPSTPSTYSLGPTHELATLQYSLIPPADPPGAAKSHHPGGLKYVGVADTKLLSFTPPPNVTSPIIDDYSSDGYTSILLYDPTDASRTRYSSTSIATRSFHAPSTGRFLLHLDVDGEAIGARYVAYSVPTGVLAGTKKGKVVGQGGEEGRGGFDVQWQKESPRVYLEKPGKGGGAGAQGQEGEGKGVGEGKEGEEGEKTLFQK